MRHELCLDNRNEPKWSVTLEMAAKVNARAIVYAAMFLGDVGEHGNELDPWVQKRGQPILPGVKKFFADERQFFRKGEAKNLWRIANLDDRIRLIKDEYNWHQQTQYVDRVLATVNQTRIDRLPVVVLLDPCNGIAVVKHRDHRHFRISPHSVSVLWAGLQSGDGLVIWQWPLPARIPANNPVNLLNAEFQQPGSRPPVGGIDEHGFGPFVMLTLAK